eukprot:GHRR01025211.1.p1 GENE.GHRR01025211.1~~GHRR01025211.1.p1  ORF type:complete len:244 (+),score=85.78 GHRR01025211.1:795-1526(+)
MYFVGEGVLEVRMYENEQGAPLPKALYKRSMTASAAQKSMNPGGLASYSKTTNSLPGALQQPVLSPVNSQAAHENSNFAVSHDGSSWGGNQAADHHAGLNGKLHQYFNSIKSGAQALAQALSKAVDRVMGRPTATAYSADAWQLSPNSSGGNSNRWSAPDASIAGGSVASSKIKGRKALSQKYTLPFHGNKKLPGNWTHVDELHGRPYRRIGYVRAGEYFGEYSCLLGDACTTTVVATTYCEL